ncbi:MAG: cupin domain-containing protein [Kofleriaceae bacterium]
MDLNADFSQRVVEHGASLPWRDSPMPGVQRRMLDRLGDEVARATSIVRYEPHSRFSPHVHGGGEEFLVLEGVFEDEHGAYPAGSYLRNPPQTRHTPGSTPGCVLLVKLWQFDLDDRTGVRVHVDQLEERDDPARPGVRVTELHVDERERVRVERWAPGARIALDASGGAEVFVLEGGFTERGDALAVHSWLRLPVGAALDAVAGAEGARVFVKTGHLRFVRRPGA